MNPTVYNIKKGIVRESPNILTAFSITGLVTTSILTGKAAVIANEMIHEEAYRRKCRVEEIEFQEKVKMTAPIFAPSIVAGVLTISCILGANSIHARRNAALAGVYSVATEALKEYQEKVVATIGKKKEERIRDEIAQDTLDRNPLGERGVVINNGDALFYDKLSGRYFKSTVEKVRKAMNDFNFELMTEMFKSVNEWYDMIGLPDVDMGAQQGWELEHGYLDIQFSTMLADNNEPCIVLTYSANPRMC